MHEYKEDIFIAGLLHDIGRTVFYINDIDRYKQFIDYIVKDEIEDFLPVEEEIFGYHHGMAGKIVLQRWNFPEEYIDTVFQHHRVHIDSPFKKMVGIIGLANQYAKILKNEFLTKKDNELRLSLLKELSISEELDKGIIENFMTDIQDDELFVMSSNL